MDPFRFLQLYELIIVGTLYCCSVALCIKSSPAIVRNFKKRSTEVADDSRKKQHVCYKEQDTWKTLTDDAGWVYYLNTKNEHWQWNAPGSLPLQSPWLKYTHRDGRTYYWNDSTKKMQLLEQCMFVIFSIMIYKFINNLFMKNINFYL